MSTLAIVLIIVAAVVVLLAIGGYVGIVRRADAEREALHAQAQEADHMLARAHADDKGWDRETMEAAARAAYAATHDSEPARLTLVQVVDRPGTDEDQAVFDADGERLVLGRRGDEWFPAG